MYLKELIASTILLIMTFLFTLIGMKEPHLVVAQEHLMVLIILYLVLLPLNAIWIYINYFRYRKPKFLWDMLLMLKRFKRSLESNDVYKLNDIIENQKFLIKVAFDDILSNDIQKRKSGLVQIRELFNGSTNGQQIEILKKLIKYANNEFEGPFKIDLMTTTCKLMKNIDTAELLI